MSNSYDNIKLQINLIKHIFKSCKLIFQYFYQIVKPTFLPTGFSPVITYHGVSKSYNIGSFGLMLLDAIAILTNQFNGLEKDSRQGKQNWQLADLIYLHQSEQIITCHVILIKTADIIENYRGKLFRSV